MANDLALYNDDENRDLIPQDDKSNSEIITLPKQEIVTSPKREITISPEREEEYSIIPTIVSNAFNRYFNTCKTRVVNVQLNIFDVIMYIRKWFYGYFIYCCNPNWKLK